MTTKEIISKINSNEYNFLRTDAHLGNNIIFLTVGGSHAYGTNIETSDLDIRGCTLNSKAEILTNQNFEQFVNNETDTTIYSFNKLISLITNCNPNTIELLGNRAEHYFGITEIGRELIDNRKMFLSQKAIYSFGGYATAQLRRLENKTIREANQSLNEKHILETLKHSIEAFKEEYGEKAFEFLKLYIDNSSKEDFDTEIFIDFTLKHYPLRDCAKIIEKMLAIVKSYSKLGSRNSKAYEHEKIAKHMMHLVRLYLMCFDILEKEEIITYRSVEHDFLMSIRNGAFLDEDNQVKPEFYDIIREYDKRFEYDKKNTSLPSKPNMKKINDFVMSVNERVVLGAAN